MSKMSLITFVSAMVVSASAYASDIEAIVPQINLFALEQSNSVSGGNHAVDINVPTSAVGNVISVNSEVDHQPDTADVNVVPVQVNLLSAQHANSIIGGSFASDDLKATTSAFANSATINSEDHANVAGLQINAISLQSANTVLTGGSVGDRLTIDTTSVGNALNVNADSNGGGFGNANVGSLQLNALTMQASNTTVIGVGVGGVLGVSTTSVGNTLSVTGSNVSTLPIQANVSSVQVANTTVYGSNSNTLNINTTAVGNSVTVSTGM